MNIKYLATWPVLSNWLNSWPTYLLTFLLPGMPIELYLLWQQYPWTFGDIACDAKIVVTEAIIYVSILNIVAFSCER